MNKKKIEKMLPVALAALQDEKNCKISENKKIKKSYRSAIAAFGAAVTMGSFKAAVAFFSKDADSGKTGIHRTNLLRTIDYICQPENRTWKETADPICTEILKLPTSQVKQKEHDFLHAAVALKLAMNAFELITDQKVAKTKPEPVTASGSTDEQLEGANT